ncbi:MAG: ATP-binding cassette domain-containing protein [Bryobacterales bacterium]|nr:ATP-binding cassette domain-containing protein [Bryobacterales bacterium]
MAVRHESLERRRVKPVLRFDHAGYSIAGRPILRDLDLELYAGETLVLLGRSGSGKTTALKLVNGLLMPTSGAVLVEERATSSWDLIRLRRRIGYVIQEGGLFPHFTVERNVGLVPSLEGWEPSKIRARVYELLTRLDLPPAQFAARYPRRLSGGERQRAGIARALAADPDILLFDEPFGALDPITRAEARKQFIHLRDTLRKTAIFVTHDVREALRVGSRIALLHQGCLEALCSPGEFLRHPGAEVRAFLASAE